MLNYLELNKKNSQPFERVDCLSYDAFFAHLSGFLAIQSLISV